MIIALCDLEFDSPRPARVLHRKLQYHMQYHALDFDIGECSSSVL